MHVFRCRNGHVRKVFETLYKESGLIGNKRDIYEEYLSTPHHCPSTMTVMQTVCSGSEWRLYSIKELSTALLEKMKDTSMVFSRGECLPSYREKLRSNQNIQVSWSYGVINYDKFDPPIVSNWLHWPVVCMYVHHSVWTRVLIIFYWSIICYVWLYMYSAMIGRVSQCSLYQLQFVSL